MTDQQPPDRSVREDDAAQPTEAEQDQQRELDEAIESTAYGASSAESGGNYDTSGPTTANVDGEPMDAGEEHIGRV